MVEWNKKRFWKLGLVFLAVFFVFFDGQTASATVECTSPEAKFRCDLTIGSGGHACATTRADCDAWCGEMQDPYGTPTQCTISEYNSTTGKTDLKTSDTKFLKPLDDFDFMLPFKWLIYAVFKFCGLLLVIAATIFGWVVEPENVSFIMNNAGLYASWAMVRDFLNLGFILVLLYIAFCVIFQIGSYSDSWKKMLLMMVIMALLVNFSFPICRFIIDISNITFYYILNVGFPGSTGEAIITDITKNAGLADISKASSVDTVYLIAITVFTFIAAITFLVIAVLFVVRMVAIGMLIIFSPIGIAGAAFPFSKKYATEWWDSLFKYAFFAPIMMFMILIAKNIMSLASKSSMISKAQVNMGAGSDPNFLGTAAFFTIPIVILWFGMGMAQKMSIAGASAVTGMAQKTAKWAGRQPWRGVKAGANATGVPGGVKQKWDKIARGFKSSQASREARVASVGPFKDAGALDRDMKRRAEEYKKENISEGELKTRAGNGDAAAAYRLADDKSLDQATYTAFMAKKPNPSIMGSFNSKVKQSRADLVAVYNSTDAKKMAEVRSSNPARAAWTNAQVSQHIIDQEIGKISADKWNEQSWSDIADTGHAGVQAATVRAHGNLKPEAQAEVRKRLNPNNVDALSTRMGVPV